jgi:hypothetical protein
MKNKILLTLTLTLLLFLSSCKVDNGLPETVQFTMHNNLPIMNAVINGHAVTLLIDTGASISIIDGNLYKILDFEIEYIQGYSIMGIGGTEVLLSTKNVKTKYNGEPMIVDFKTTNLLNLRKNIGVVGIVGGDFFIQNNIIIDYKNKVVRKSNILD